LCKIKKIKGLRGGVQTVRRTCLPDQAQAGKESRRLTCLPRPAQAGAEIAQKSHLWMETS